MRIIKLSNSIDIDNVSCEVEAFALNDYTGNIKFYGITIHGRIPLDSVISKIQNISRDLIYDDNNLSHITPGFNTLAFITSANCTKEKLRGILNQFFYNYTEAEREKWMSQRVLLASIFRPS